jgi:Tol biopolymer transport system component/DNA-binding winged helix-turn-helix (wHTH) protein
MSIPLNHLYEFGPYQLDRSQMLLFRHGDPVSLTSKAIEVLLVLVEADGRLVEKERLMKAVWPDTFVEEGNLTFNIHVLRRVLGGDSDHQSYIETIPRRGYRFVAQVRVLHQPLKRAAVQSAVESSPESTPAPASLHQGKLWIWLSGGAIVAALLMLVLIWNSHRNEIQSTAPLVVTPLTSAPGSIQSIALSPDGSRIAYSWSGPGAHPNWDIYVKIVSEEHPLRLTDDPGLDKSPAWSPDGGQIAFIRERQDEKSASIYSVGSLGGSERKLTDVPYGRYFDLAWSPDGRSIAYSEKKSHLDDYDDFRAFVIYILSVDTLEKRQLTFPPSEMSDQRFAFSPNGKELAFLRFGLDNGVGIFRIPVDGGTPTQIYSENAWVGHVAWSSDGNSLIYTSSRDGGNKLWRVPITGGKPEPLPLAEELVFYPTISQRGDRMAYIREYFDSDLYFVDLANMRGTGKTPVSILASARVETNPAFSHDGKKIAFYADRSGRRELWLAGADGSDAIQLTDFYAWATVAPSWSPDDTHLVFFAGFGPGGSSGGLFVMNVKDKDIRRLTSQRDIGAPRWSRDGKWIFASSSAAIWKIPAEGGTPVPISQNGGVLEQESPDGRYLYYLKGARGIWRMSAGGGNEEVVLPDFNTALHDHWQPMDDGVFYVNDRTHPYPMLEFFEFSSHKSRPLVMLSGEPTSFNGGLTVSPDRKQIVYSQESRSGSDIMLVEHFH